MSVYFYFREKIRLNSISQRVLYFSQYVPRFVRNLPESARSADGDIKNGAVALCLRFRNEAHYLSEWLEYYLAAGVSHFFLYNNLSTDDYKDVLAPYIAGGLVSLIDWPYSPVSPRAENDCVRRALGRYEWLGFIDTDEFVVIADGRSIPEFLSGFRRHPGVALHWLMFGSNNHKARPSGNVVSAYTKRATRPNFHVKCFVKPSQALMCRNSHSWYFRRFQYAVNESGKPVTGSVSIPPTVAKAWINHYYCKSEEDYLSKAKVNSMLDQVGIKFPSRTNDRLGKAMKENNDLADASAIQYLTLRRALAPVSDRRSGTNA